MGAGLASAVAALFTSRFGVAGTVIGAALTTMIITAGSALFGLYVERAAARARGGIPGVVRVRPPRRRSILLGALLAAAEEEEGRLRAMPRKRALRSWEAAGRLSPPSPDRAASGSPGKPRLPASKRFPTPQAPLEGGPAAWWDQNPAARPGMACLPKNR